MELDLPPLWKWHRLGSRLGSCLEPQAAETFAKSLFQVTRYYELLELIVHRFHESERKHTLSSTDNRPRLLEEDLFRALQLDSESFYIFAKILLDKAAYTFRLFFGDPPPGTRRVSAIKSHHDLVDNLDAYATAKGITAYKDLLFQAVELQRLVSDLRDSHITHEPSPRATKGVIINPGGQINLYAYRTSKSPGTGTEAEFPHIDEIMTRINQYTDSLAQLFDNNFELTALKRSYDVDFYG